MRPADDLEGSAPRGEIPPRGVRRRCSCDRQGDEAVQRAIAPIDDPAELRHHHRAASSHAAGKVTPAGRPMTSRRTKGGSVSALRTTLLILQSRRLDDGGMKMGSVCYPKATKLLITADSGGSNGSRVRLWKLALQRFAKEAGLKISVSHFPPGTSKWNKIEHRMFCHITQNWRGRPLTSRQVIVKLIGNTTTSPRFVPWRLELFSSPLIVTLIFASVLSLPSAA